MMAQFRTIMASMVVALGLLAACAAPGVPTAIPAKPPAPAAATAAPQAAATTAAPAPTAPAAAAPKVKRGGTLRAAYFEEWAPTLDPHSMTSVPFGFELMYDTLVRTSLDVKTGKRTNKPGLAESWDQPDPKTIVMKLRKGVVFQDGSPFNAEVAKWNLDRMRTWAKSAAKTDVAVIDSVDIVDDYTIRINLKGAPAGILYRLGDTLGLRGWIASKAAVDRDGENALTRRPVGSGPMQFVEWLTGDRITVKKWDKYWEKGADGQPLPYLDGAVLRVIVDETVGVTEMRTGNLDIYGQAEPRNFAVIKADPKLDLVQFPWVGLVNYLIFNVEKPPFNNIKVRQAALYAIDREGIAKGAGQGIGVPSYYYWGPADLGYDDKLPHYTFDMNKAQQLMKDAGFASGVDVVDDFFQNELMQRTAEAFKQTWDKAGIRTELNLSERTAFVSKLQVGNFQVANSIRQWGESDPDAYSYRLTSEGTFNFAHFKNADMDKCMEEGRNTADDAKRAEIYKRCQQILFENAPYDQVWFTPYVIVVNKAVKGWEPNHFTRVKMHDVWIDK
ncbi:MAG: ABC transporter substrate-binding protein [Chloroflexi bacterium]|nr:ABC transporter substrate-binding protein [Chloroflexota bacterium]